jgi:XTP/dITP diphosphohydrolase
MKILYASNNQDKINDIKSILPYLNLKVEVMGLKEAGIQIEVEETGITLLQNATLKAQQVYEIIKQNNEFDLIIGEDFGFYLQAYPNIAGLYAKRWKMGSNLDRATAIVKLYDTKNPKNKTATFSCAMCAINQLGVQFQAVKHLQGNIGSRLPKEGGFGYHQIVQMQDGRYLNEYSVQEKMPIWSRHQAFVSILEEFNSKK